jgi:MoxR-like ATPase
MDGALPEVIDHVRRELRRAVVGQQDALDLLLVTVLCGGHALVEGVPGVGKTLAVRALGELLGLGFTRVQGTPDLMPADIVGTAVLNMASGQFTVKRGPVFTDLLLVDEINRLPPRTQSGLLEAMEERHVSIDGITYALPAAFAVFATQNPIEFEGTYPLPEAQLDRFLVKIRFAYPNPATREEIEVLEKAHQGFNPNDLAELGLQRLNAASLADARRELAAVRVDPSMFDYVAAIARRSREWPALTLGVSPRAAIALLQVAKAVAALEGRSFLVPDDVKDAAVPVLGHRLLLRPEADLEGMTSAQVVSELLAAIEVPK